MVSFDALRAAILGPLAYIGIPKKKPDELLALYPFDGDLIDISNYGRTFASSDYTFTNDGPFGKCLSAFTGTVVHDAVTKWSVDFYGYFVLAGSGGTTVKFSAGTTQYGLYGVNNDVICQLTSTNTWFTSGLNSFVHYALTYDGSDLRGYTNGVRAFKTSASLNVQSTINFVKKNYIKLSNLRVVGKVLGTDTAFPVPTDFYTGYEAL